MVAPNLGVLCVFFSKEETDSFLKGVKGDVGAEGGRGFTNFWISHIVFFLGGLVIGNDRKKQIRWFHELPEECCAQNLRLFHSI